jgi:hypothetical protein
MAVAHTTDQLLKEIPGLHKAKQKNQVLLFYQKRHD